MSVQDVIDKERNNTIPITFTKRRDRMLLFARDALKLRRNFRHMLRKLFKEEFGRIELAQGFFVWDNKGVIFLPRNPARVTLDLDEADAKLAEIKEKILEEIEKKTQ